MIDKLLLQNMVFYGFHGVYEYEKEHGQRFYCDVELCGDFSEAAASDDLICAIDYTKVYETIKEIIENQRFNLIEALAGSIANTLLGKFPLVEVTVRIRKPSCPLPGTLDYIQTEITRGVTR